VRFNRSQLSIAGGLSIGANQDRTSIFVMRYSTLTGNSEMLGTSTGAMLDVGTWHSSDPGSTRNERLRLRNGAVNEFSAAGSVPRNSDLILTVAGDSNGNYAWRNGTSILNTPIRPFTWTMGGAGVNLGIGYQLLYSPTNAFSFAPLPLARLTAGDQVSFAVADGLLNPGYYTLAQAVPEPSAWVLLALGALVLAWRRSRRFSNLAPQRARRSGFPA